MRNIMLVLFCFIYSNQGFAESEKTVLQVTTFTDYVNSHSDLEKAITFDVDTAFAEKYYLEFYMFYRKEDEICFKGSIKEASKIVETILSASTGDAYVDFKKADLTNDTITQDVNFEDEGGGHEFTLVVKRCP